MTEQPLSAVSTDTKPLRGHNVVAVASGKGGVGKTWFSITLSHAMARMGRRTLLFDGDLGLANVDIQLGLTPKYDLGSVIEGRIDLQQATLRHDGGFDILAGRSGSGSLSHCRSPGGSATPQTVPDRWYSFHPDPARYPRATHSIGTTAVFFTITARPSSCSAYG